MSIRLALIIVLSTIALRAQSSYPHNAASCEQCHSVPAKFGSSRITVQRNGAFDYGKFVPAAEGGIRHRVRETQAPLKEGSDPVASDRVALNLLGDGYIEAIDSNDIRRNLDKQGQENTAIRGSLVPARVLESRAAKTTHAGRFGWKSQHSSLLSACADSMRNELGIRNRLYAEEYATHDPKDGPTPFDKPDPKTGKTELERLVEEIRHTEPPARDEQLAGSTDAQEGEKIFAQIGCALCHVSTYRTLPEGTVINGGTYRVPAHLGHKVIHPYSDFLLHDVGTGDGIPQAAKPEYLDQSTANRFRTAPLWGLRFRSWMMHDGKSITYHQAIVRHGGEAAGVRERYEELTPVEKQQLRAFLNSL